MPKRTPLYETHLRLGARIVPFAGWEMPVQFKGIIEEHMAVRERAGLFDVSHMGEIKIAGPKAFDLLQYLLTNDLARLSVGGAQYNTMLNEQGGIIDDLIAYRASDHFLLIPNASNTEKVFNWIKAHAGQDVEVVNETMNWGEVALQGPQSQEILQKLISFDLNELAYFHFIEGEKIAGAPVIISRTGYTGEDGFEILSSWDETPSVWDALMEAGGDNILPCGLGARDTLRLEMKYPLHGNDIDETTNPLEAGLGWAVKLAKGDFIGKEVLLKVKEEGLTRKLVGFELLEPGVPRAHCDVLSEGGVIGKVTSGAFSPCLKIGIGMAYLKVGYDKIGTDIYILIRDKKVPAMVVETPFWKKGTVGKIRAKEA